MILGALWRKCQRKKTLLVLTNLGVIKITRSNAIDLSSKNRKGIEMNMIWIKKFFRDDSGASAMEYAHPNEPHCDSDN